MRVTCPSCAATAELRDGECGSCPGCGQTLGDAQTAPAPGAAGHTHATEVIREHGEHTAETAGEPDGALIADLRDAFGFDEGLDVHGVEASERSRTGFESVLASAARAPASRLGDFEIVEELGRGGMGIVYRARQVSLDRVVALKVLPGYARHGQMAVQRFRAEAQAAARVHHTNIVPVYGQGEQDGCFYYAMELIDGVGLDQVIRSRPDLLSSTRARSRSGGNSSTGWRFTSRGARAGSASSHIVADTPSADDRGTAEPTSADDAAHWTRADFRYLAALVADVADGLECAHQQGVIHRDVKPHNIMLGNDGRLYLTDFGLARLTDSPHLTQSGEVLGTPAYLSPEQVRGDTRQIEGATDIYSLGVTLYELLTRRKPFDGENRAQIMHDIVHRDPIPPRRVNPQVPIDLETVCLRALSKEPGQRHVTAGELAEDLRRFADGRPILSRRAGPIEKTVKWVRRHKALSVAIGGAAAVLLLSLALTWSVSAAQRREGLGLLRDAYEQLAFVNYREPGLVWDDIERAAGLGAPERELHVVRGLALIGRLEWPAAIEALEQAIAINPHDLRPRYMLAWVLGEDEQNALALERLAEAESRGPPTTADEWFFRGLALHFDQPDEAVVSYRRANELRAGAAGFYPQALLHLARARNQQLYVTRKPESFADAVSSLELLADNGYYEAYPHYLLSIAHRLTAEIYRGSVGTRGDIADEYFAQALDWARRGQELVADDERCITAEAEALESLGLYEEAIAARTRAIAHAPHDLQAWEGHHYRWRLRYWTGDYEGALADLDACAGYDENDPFYEHVYPAWVLAAMGETDAAHDHAAALLDEHPGVAWAVIWSATCLRLTGAAAEAELLLEHWQDGVEYHVGLTPPQDEAWLRALYGLCRGQRDVTALETLADEVAAPWKLWGEAYFHVAALNWAAGEQELAVEQMREAYRAFDGEQRYTYQALALLGFWTEKRAGQH